MFDTLTDRLDGIFAKLRSRGKLHPKQVDAALADLRVALLEADVAAEVADDLLARVRVRALSEEVMKSLTPAQQVIKIVRDELQDTMGGTQVPFALPSAKPRKSTSPSSARQRRQRRSRGLAGCSWRCRSLLV